LPAGFKGLLVGGRRENWECELAYIDHEPFQVVGLFGKPAAANECTPLDRPRRISIEGIGEPNRFGFDSRAAMPEGGDARSY
jgi:hypothetical protein